MGFGLPSALGAAAAFDGKDRRESKVVVDIDGDGSFLMNVQEMAVAFIEQFNLKVFILNNQHLGMVVQWENRFYKVFFHIMLSPVTDNATAGQSSAYVPWQ